MITIFVINPIYNRKQDTIFISVRSFVCLFVRINSISFSQNITGTGYNAQLLAVSIISLMMYRIVLSSVAHITLEMVKRGAGLAVFFFLTLKFTDFFPRIPSDFLIFFFHYYGGGGGVCWPEMLPWSLSVCCATASCLVSSVSVLSSSPSVVQWLSFCLASRIIKQSSQTLTGW